MIISYVRRYIQRRRAFEDREHDRIEEQRRYEQSILVKHNRVRLVFNVCAECYIVKYVVVLE